MFSRFGRFLLRAALLGVVLLGVLLAARANADIPALDAVPWWAPFAAAVVVIVLTGVSRHGDEDDGERGGWHDGGWDGVDQYGRRHGIVHDATGRAHRAVWRPNSSAFGEIEELDGMKADGSSRIRDGRWLE
ncbi:hypothetical protein GS504_01130 [Rhodococcus hoagii]|nr:hypothetical protein [Prescottella equi]NKS71725.1 hypothetical protein [Prescottella equi]